MNDNALEHTIVLPLQFDNYTLIEKIGEGANGVVYKSKQISTDQHVAIKIAKINKRSDSKEQFKNRFDRETNFCAKINHPNIVKLIDRGVTIKDIPYAVYEYIEGETLKDKIIKEYGIPAEETIQIMEQVLDALFYIHSQGIVHRDLKPSNIVLTKTGSKNHVKILDFGIGAFTSQFHFRSDSTTTEGFVGTPAYCAPEQLRGEPASAKSDLYSWGIIFIECLTGQPVLKAKSVWEIIQLQLNQSTIALPPIIQNHPLSSILTKVLEKNPHDRHDDAGFLLKQLNAISSKGIAGFYQYENDNTTQDTDDTIVNNISSTYLKTEKRQITVLCAELAINAGQSNLDLESIDTIREDQLHVYKDIASRFGGYVAGNIADNIVVYFGYPQISENDARKAGRTALEFMTQVKKRSALIDAQYGITMKMRIGINSGIVISKPNTVPSGSTTNIAYKLLSNTSDNSILVGENTKKLLDNFLEFKKQENLHIDALSTTIKTYLLIGEQKAEALSFMNAKLSNRNLYGRDAEFATVKKMWSTATKLSERSKFFIGEPGIGKSRLLNECKKFMHSQEALIAECQCLPEFQNSTLQPVFNYVKKLIGIENSETNYESLIEDFFQKAGCNVKTCMPIFCSWASISISNKYNHPNITPDEQKDILFRTLQKCIFSKGGNKTALVIEDIHWADPTTLEFIDFLTDEKNQFEGILFVTSHPREKIKERFGQNFIIELGSLTKDDTQQIIGEILNVQTINDDVTNYIYSKTDGIPLYIEEFTVMLRENGMLSVKKKTCDFADKEMSIAIPSTLRGLLYNRLEKTGFAKETAQLASAIGREFPYDLLIEISDKEEWQVQTDLDLLQNMGLIFCQRNIDKETYIFRHSLICDAAYDSMLVQEKLNYHALIATTLISEFPLIAENSPEIIAHHFSKANQFQNAVTYGIKAIKKYVANTTFAEAISFNKQILAWVKKIEDHLVKNKTELSLNVVMLPVYTMSSGWADEKLEKLVIRNQELISEIHDKEKHLSNPELESGILKSEWVLFSNYHSQGKIKKARKIGEELLHKVKKTDNVRLEMVVTAFLGHAYLNDGDIFLARDVLYELINSHEKDGDYKIYMEYGFDPCVHAYGNLCLLEFIIGNCDTALILGNKGIEYAEKTESPIVVSMLYVFFTLCTALLNKKELTRELLHEVNIKYKAIIANGFVDAHLLIIEDWANDEIVNSEKSIHDLVNAGQHGSIFWYEPLLAQTYIKKGLFDKAITLMQNSIKRELEFKENIIFTMPYLTLAIAQYKKEGTISDVVKFSFQRAIEEAQIKKTTWLQFLAQLEYTKALAEQNYEDVEILKLKQVHSLLKEGKETIQYLEANEILSKQ